MPLSESIKLMCFSVSADAAAVVVLLHACSDNACLPVVPDKQRLCTPVAGPLSSESTALMLLRIHCHCHFSSLQLAGSSLHSVLSRAWDLK